jgi:membrane-bound ClpP family serine protease
MLGFLSDVSVLSIALFAVGVILLIIEMFQPGFGAAGTLGVIALAADIFVTAKTLAQGLVLAAVVAALILVFLIIGTRLVSKGRLPKPLVLREATSGKSGSLGSEDIVGKKGTAQTALRPAGIADFGGLRLDVVSQSGFVDRGEQVEIVEKDGNRIVVKPIK